jgi:hypothetical protein
MEPITDTEADHLERAADVGAPPTVMDREPAVIIGLVTAAIEALIALVVAFGVELTGEQVAAIMGFVAAAGAVIAALLTRARVYAPATVAKLLE